jgi:hypothetical protein
VATEENLRSIAMSLPQIEEHPAYGGRPSWRVAGRGFVGIRKDQTSGVIPASDLAEKQTLLTDDPDKFFTTDHYRDSARPLVRLSEVGIEELRELVPESWAQQAPPDLIDLLDQPDPT